MYHQTRWDRYRSSILLHFKDSSKIAHIFDQSVTVLLDSYAFRTSVSKLLQSGGRSSDLEMGEQEAISAPRAAERRKEKNCT